MSDSTTNTPEVKENAAQEVATTYRNWANKEIEGLAFGLLGNVSHDEIIESLYSMFSILVQAPGKDAETIAEDVSFMLYKYHSHHDDAFNRWNKELLSNLDFPNKSGIAGSESEPAAPAARYKAPESSMNTAPEPLSANQPTPANLTEHMLQITGNKLRHVFASAAVPNEVKNTLRDIICDAQNEIGVQIYDPEIIKTALPAMFQKGSLDYNRGVLHSIESILDGIAPAYFPEGELSRFETRFDAAPQKSAPLDLSACEPEHLNTRLSELPTMRDFACALSGLLHNPLIPDKLFNMIANEVGEYAEDWEDTTLVQQTLEQMKKTDAPR